MTLRSRLERLERLAAASQPAAPVLTDQQRWAAVQWLYRQGSQAARLMLLGTLDRVRGGRGEDIRRGLATLKVELEQRPDWRRGVQEVMRHVT